MEPSTHTPSALEQFTKPRSILIAVSVVIVFLLIVFNQGRGVAKTKSEIEYEKWLSTTETKQNPAVVPQTLPSLTLRIFPLDGAKPVSEMKVSPTTSTESANRVLRLLQLAREAGLFGYSDSRPGEREGDIILKIESPDKTFDLKFPARSVETNVKAGLFLKLFQEFSKPEVPKVDEAKVAKDADPVNNLTIDDTDSLPHEVEEAISNSEKTPAQ